MYGASAAGLAAYSVVMLGALDPGFKFDTYWNAGVVANFISGMVVCLPLAVLWPITYAMPELYIVNYIFLFMAFIFSWHMISSFYISVGLMVASLIMET